MYILHEHDNVMSFFFTWSKLWHIEYELRRYNVSQVVYGVHQMKICFQNISSCIFYFTFRTFNFGLISTIQDIDTLRVQKKNPQLNN